MPGQKGVTFTKWHLLEFSAVPVPANPQALAQVAKGMDELDDPRAKDWLENFKDLLEDKDTMVDTYLKSIREENKEHDFGDDAAIETMTIKKDPTDFGDKDSTIIYPVSFTKEDMQEIVMGSVQKALNPLLHDEFKYDPEDFGTVAKAMIALFHNKTLPEYQRKHVYDHLSELYKKHEKTPPKFGEEPEVKEHEVKTEVSIPLLSDATINSIISGVKAKMNKEKE